MRTPKQARAEKAHQQLAKINRPILAHVYARVRLFSWLDKARRKHPIIWVQAPPGAGKTTLIASYLQARKLSTLWYQVDAGDSDIASFFYYMGLAGKQAAPRRRNPLPLLTPEYFAGLPTFTRNFFRELFDRLKHPGVLVLDNYQDVPLDTPVHELLPHGLSEIPQGVTVVVLSRAEPPASLARLRASNHIAVLQWDDLQLTEKEGLGIATLRSGKARPTQLVVQTLHKQTDGWAAGLVLALEQARQSPASKSTSSATDYSAIFDYFAGEVFQRADPTVQDLLLKTAFLPKVTASVAQTLTNNPKAETILSDLARRNYFTVRHAEGSYDYHPLFREFLAAHARNTWSPSQLVQHLHQTAAMLEQTAQFDAALLLYLEAGDPTAATHAILAQAPSLAAAGRFATIAAAIARLPQSFQEEAPWLQYWQGICRLSVDPAQARPYFERAYKKFRVASDSTGCYLSWVGFVESFTFLWDDFNGLKSWVTAELKSLRRDFKKFPNRMVEERVVCAAFTANFWVGPKTVEIGKWTEHAERVAREGLDPNTRVLTAASLGLHYWMTGEAGRLESITETARELARSESATPLARLYVLGTEAIQHWFSGAGEKSREVALEAVALARDSGVHVWDAYIMAQVIYASVNIGDLDFAETYLEEFRRHLPPACRMHVAHWRFHAAHLSLLRGNFKRAEEHIRIGVELVKELGADAAVAMGELALARVLVELNKFEEARVLLEKILPFAREMESPHFEFQCFLIHAWMAWHVADEFECVNHLRRAFGIAAKQDFKSYGTWDPTLMSKLCQVALKHGVEAHYVDNLIRTRRLLPDPSSSDMESWPFAIKIYTFGRFSVLVDGKPLKFSTKAQKKPLELLRALIAFGGRQVREEMLIEALWPDSESADRAFTSAIHRLRKLIGEAAIERQDGRITLDSRYCWVDVWAVERVLTELEQVSLKGKMDKIVSLAERALALYRGVFLASESDASWALSARERLRTKLLRRLEVAARTLAEGNYQEHAITCYTAAIGIDPLTEIFYRGLMQSYLTLQRRAEALTTYERLRHALHTELGIAPSPQTDALATLARAG